MERYIKYPIILIVILVLLGVIPTSATTFKDIPPNAVYLDSIERLSSLDIIAGDENNEFKPNEPITRGQFAKIMVLSAGLENAAQTLKGISSFSDIPVNTMMNGYINAAINYNFITSPFDDKFVPNGEITYAQICTVLVRALGYTTSADVPGEWPLNYISKASLLGLTKDIALKSDQSVPRWVAILMIDRFMTTDVNKNISAVPKKFIETTGHYSLSLIYGDSITSASLAANQVLTDNGVFYNRTNKPLKLGCRYILTVKDGTILKAAEVSESVKNISVDIVTGGKISYLANGKSESMTLPENITYYYQGLKTDFSKVIENLQKCSSIILTYNSDKSGFEYGCVFDPIYSKPEVAINFIPSSRKLGNIYFTIGSTVVRDGKPVDIYQIKNRDIVYSVSDIWGGNRYYLAMDNKIGGEIIAVNPSLLSPKTITIDGADYSFSSDIDAGKIANAGDALAVGNNIIIYLGRDGKIVHFEFFGAEDNSGYALLLDTSTTIDTRQDGTKAYTYEAKLLFDVGVTGTYRTDTNLSKYKGKLVKYEFTDHDTISLEQYSEDFSGEAYIDKDNRLLNDIYVSDNVRIFNIIYNEHDSEIKAEVLKWSDLPSGRIPNGSIWYSTSGTGPFNDVNVIFTDDILGERYKVGIVKSVSSGRFNALIGNKEYTFAANITNITAGYVMKFKMNEKGISGIEESLNATDKGTSITGIDSRRIKMNGTVFFLDKSISVYFKDTDGNISAKTLADIETGFAYQQIYLYKDLVTNKVKAIYIIQ